jgi:hypothetical protein
MLTQVHPKLPMRNKQITWQYYVQQLGFTALDADEYPEYLMVTKDAVELHFFLFENLNPTENYGQIYLRVKGIETWYQYLQSKHVAIHPNAPLQLKPWGVWEFSLLDPDNNLLTFGEAF